MVKTRKKYSAEFKLKVVLEVLKREKTESNKCLNSKTEEQEKGELFEQIGRLDGA